MAYEPRYSIILDKDDRVRAMIWKDNVLDQSLPEQAREAGCLEQAVETYDVLDAKRWAMKLWFKRGYYHAQGFRGAWQDAVDQFVQRQLPEWTPSIFHHPV